MKCLVVALMLLIPSVASAQCSREDGCEGREDKERIVNRINQNIDKMLLTANAICDDLPEGDDKWKCSEGVVALIAVGFIKATSSGDPAVIVWKAAGDFCLAAAIFYDIVSPLAEGMYQSQIDLENWLGYHDTWYEMMTLIWEAGIGF